jgi:hypothetical protein
MKDAIIVEAMNLEATPEAAVERQDLFKEETNPENIGLSEARYGEQHLAVQRCRGAKKLIQDSVGSRQKLSTAHKCHTSNRPCHSKRKNS